MGGRKILFLMWAEMSAYNATFQLARTLVARGYQVTYAVPERWIETIARQGFPAVIIELSREWPSHGSGWLRRILSSRKAAGERLTALRHSLRISEGFACVMVYTTLWQHAAALRQMGVPFISINPSLAASWSADVPPIFSSLKPEPRRPWLNRLRCSAAWLRLRYFGEFSHRYHGIIPDRPETPRARLRDVRTAARHFLFATTERLRMPEYYRLLRLARGMGIKVAWGDYGHRLNGVEWVLGAKELDFAARTTQPGRLYVGACVDPQRAEEGYDWSRVDASRPLVYCSIGSHGGYWNQPNRLRLVRAAVEAFKIRPWYQLLLQLTGQQDENLLGALPENVLAAPWFPQLEALSRSALMMTHGGFGSVREALFYGVPMILFPCGVDQPGNAARVVLLGAGVQGDIRSVTPASLGELLDHVMDDPAYSASARRVRLALRANNDCAAALSYLDAFLSGR